MDILKARVGSGGGGDMGFLFSLRVDWDHKLMSLWICVCIIVARWLGICVADIVVESVLYIPSSTLKFFWPFPSVFYICNKLRIEGNLGLWLKKASNSLPKRQCGWYSETETALLSLPLLLFKWHPIGSRKEIDTKQTNGALGEFMNEQVVWRQKLLSYRIAKRERSFEGGSSHCVVEAGLQHTEILFLSVFWMLGLKMYASPMRDVL